MNTSMLIARPDTGQSLTVNGQHKGLSGAIYRVNRRPRKLSVPANSIKGCSKALGSIYCRISNLRILASRISGEAIRQYAGRVHVL